MSMSRELQLGLARLSAELGNLQRAVRQVLESGELPARDIGTKDFVAEAQYLALEAAIRSQESRAARDKQTEQDEKPAPWFARSPGHRSTRKSRWRAVGVPSPPDDALSPTNDKQRVARD